MRKVIVISMICFVFGILASCKGAQKCPAYDKIEIENTDVNA